MNLKIFSAALALIVLLLLPANVFASNMQMDGEFTDWENMPSLTDRQGDGPASQDIVEVKWFPDTENSLLYLYCERKSGICNDKNNPYAVDWNFQVEFDGEQGKSTAFVDYHPESRQTEVKLVDGDGRYLWSAKGKWGDEAETANRVEFYIPLSYIADSKAPGFQFNMCFQSLQDRVPDYGFITVSTASTFPWFSVLLLIAWLLLTIFLHKRKMYFFKFLAGSIGMFAFIMKISAGIGERWLEYGVSWCLWLISGLLGIFSTNPEYSLITVHHGLQAVSFIVDFECSGLIELSVFLCLLAFYPVYGIAGKLKYGGGGALFIFGSNVIRILAICILIKLFGSSLFFLSHTVFARILFFGLMVALYHYVFTRPHIMKQKVGNLSYD